MENLTIRRDKFIGLPFYIFISLLLGTLAVAGMLAVSKVNPPVVAFLYSLLFIVHIGLYWFNLKFFQTTKWSLFYYTIQTILLILLVNFPYGNNIGTIVLASAVICLIGESLGLWGNTKRSLVMGLFYFGLAVVLLYFLVGSKNLGFAISNLVINGGFIVLFMMVLNQVLAEHQKAVDLAESLESANAKLAAYAAKIELLTLQNERQRMARELHDTLAQGVAGLVLQLEAVRAHLGANRNDRAAAIIEQALGRARSTLAESRAAIDDLRAEPVSLPESIREKVDRFTQATSISCKSEIMVKENQLSPETTTHILNIFSEALANIARHAQATQVHVNFAVQNRTLDMEIRDNGMGFDVCQQTSGHYGLLGMHERARLAGGNLTIESNKNGTYLHLVIGRQG